MRCCWFLNHNACACLLPTFHIRTDLVCRNVVTKCRTVQHNLKGNKKQWYIPKDVAHQRISLHQLWSPDTIHPIQAIQILLPLEEPYWCWISLYCTSSDLRTPSTQYRLFTKLQNLLPLLRNHIRQDYQHWEGLFLQCPSPCQARDPGCQNTKSDERKCSPVQRHCCAQTGCNPSDQYLKVTILAIGLAATRIVVRPIPVQGVIQDSFEISCHSSVPHSVQTNSKVPTAYPTAVP